LYYEFPSESRFFAEETQFMLGSALMICPVTAAGVSSVDVAFPAGKWYRYDTLAVATEGTEPAPMERGVPAWLRGGSIVPRQERVRRSSHQMRFDPLTLVVALDEQQQAQGALYWDDGETFDYTRGHSVERGFSFVDGKLSNTNLVKKESVYKSKLMVERLVIVGLAQAPTQVKLVEGGAKTLDWDYNAAAGVLTVRKPELSIDEEWKVSFE
jgi:alpha 1,3-glucosidase